MTEQRSLSFSRRALLGAFAATTLTAAPTFTKAAGFLRGAGDIRRLKMYSARTGEKIDMIYWIEGYYIKDAVKELTYFMRDWRTNDIKNIDMRTMDIMAASHNLLDVSEPYMLLSGYRSPQHNKRARGSRNSLHMYCAAADIQVAGIGKWELAQYLRSMPGRGGVGTYCHTKSVHIDVGPERDEAPRLPG